MYLIYSKQCGYCKFLGEDTKYPHPTQCKNPEILLERDDNGDFDEDEWWDYPNNYDEDDDCNLNCKYFIKKEATK
jgi:hypothetical protein